MLPITVSYWLGFWERSTKNSTRRYAVLLWTNYQWINLILLIVIILILIVPLRSWRP